MSHGRRMLEAQAQKERTSGTAPDGRLDDGHLRTGARALNDDGTPVRPSRGAPADETGNGGDALLTSPPPRPTVQFGQSGSSSAAATTRPPRLSGVALFAAGGGGGGGGGAASASTALTAAPRVSASRGPEDSATRSPDTSPRRRRSSTGTTAAPAARSRSRTGGSGSGTAPSAAVRYPVSRVNVTSAAATAAPLHYERDEGSSSSRRSPPAVTAAAALLHRQPPSATAAVPATRPAPPPAPVTAALGGPPAPALATAAAAGVAPRPPPLHSSPPYAEMAMPMSPASPPLRAGVSPRMLPLHPTRADGSTAASLSRSRAASTATTTAVGAPTQSPSSQPPFPPTQPDSQVSPYELRQAQPYAMPPTPPSHTTTGTQAVVAGSKAEEPHAAWRSAPPSPLPATATAPLGAAQRLSPLPPSRTDAGVSEATAGAVAREEAENGEERERDGYGGVDDGFHDLDTPLTRMIDARHCPYMNDFSGFHNNGNDCYGCSLLTMLLRSPVFRRALLTSPIISAARRYEALLTRKAERRVLWMSGYVDTAPSTVGVGDGAKSGKATAPRKRPRPALDADASVAEVCGLPRDSAAQTVDVACTFTAAVQRTLDVLESFGVEELEEALEVDLETGRVPATLHSALAGLARSQRWREYMTHVINADHTRAAERQRLMELKIYHDNDRAFDGQQYTNGIRLNAIAAVFTGEFFLGDQEDAHELFVAVMAKLEAEAVAFQQRCAEVLARRSAASDGESTADTTSSRGGSAEPAENGGDKAVVKQTADVVTVPTPPPSSLSTEVAEVWVNTLVQTRLLNIIRCRTAGCQHKIVTDEIYVNLSLHIPDEAAAAAVAPAAAPAAAPLAESLPFSPTSAAAAASTFPAPPTVVAAPPASATATLMAIVGAPAASEEPAPAPAPVSVAQLLRDSMAYEALRDYRCDGCGSTASQFQGGCFYTCAPPVLVLQLKRFATQFVNGAIHIDKNARRVACEDVLIVHALPSAEELRAHHLRRSRLEAGTARGGNGDGKHGGVPELATPGFGLGAAGAAYYDPENKCFSSELQSAYESGADSAEAGQVWAIRCVYRLRSCVLHLGQSLHYGHYVADFAVDGEASPTRSPSSPSLSPPSSDFDGDAEGDSAGHSCGCRRRWRRANDERVDVLRDAVVRTRRTGRSDTYLLLYERVAEEWVRCAAAAVLPRPVYESGE